MANWMDEVAAIQRAAYAERRGLPGPAPRRRRRSPSHSARLVIGLVAVVAVFYVVSQHGVGGATAGNAGTGLVAVQSVPEQVGAWRVRLLADSLTQGSQGGEWYRARWIIRNDSAQPHRLSSLDFTGGSPSLAVPVQSAGAPVSLTRHLLPLGLVPGGESIRGDTVFPLLGGGSRARVRFQPFEGNPMQDRITWSMQETTRRYVVVVP